jgi:predicted ester cyclase
MNTIDMSFADQFLFARQFLQRLHAAVNAHDAPAIAALCCDDVVWEDPAAPQTLHGRDAVLRFHRDIMFPALPDARVEIIDGPYLSLDRAGIAVRLRISGTMTGALTPPGFAPTGGRLSFETAEFSHFRDGLLAQHAVVLDMLDLARQIGAVPNAGTFGARVGVWMQHVAAFRARARRA